MTPSPAHLAATLALAASVAHAEPPGAVITCAPGAERVATTLEYSPGDSSLPPFALRRSEGQEAQWTLCTGGKGSGEHPYAVGKPIPSPVPLPLAPSDQDLLKSEGPWIHVHCPIGTRHGQELPYVYTFGEDFFVPARVIEGRQPAKKPFPVAWMLDRLPNPHPRGVLSGCRVRYSER